jgi:hypothetical protein
VVPFLIESMASTCLLKYDGLNDDHQSDNFQEPMVNSAYHISPVRALVMLSVIVVSSFFTALGCLDVHRDAAFAKYEDDLVHVGTGNVKC